MKENRILYALGGVDDNTLRKRRPTELCAGGLAAEGLLSLQPVFAC